LFLGIETQLTTNEISLYRILRFFLCLAWVGVWYNSRPAPWSSQFSIWHGMGWLRRVGNLLLGAGASHHALSRRRQRRLLESAILFFLFFASTKMGGTVHGLAEGRCHGWGESLFRGPRPRRDTRSIDAANTYSAHYSVSSRLWRSGLAAFTGTSARAGYMPQTFPAARRREWPCLYGAARRDVGPYRLFVRRGICCRVLFFSFVLLSILAPCVYERTTVSIFGSAIGFFFLDGVFFSPFFGPHAPLIVSRGAASGLVGFRPSSLRLRLRLVMGARCSRHGGGGGGHWGIAVPCASALAGALGSVVGHVLSQLPHPRARHHANGI
jgi:hypothetical protein